MKKVVTLTGNDVNKMIYEVVQEIYNSQLDESKLGNLTRAAAMGLGLAGGMLGGMHDADAQIRMSLDGRNNKPSSGQTYSRQDLERSIDNTFDVLRKASEERSPEKQAEKKRMDDFMSQQMQDRIALKHYQDSVMANDTTNFEPINHEETSSKNDSSLTDLNIYKDKTPKQKGLTIKKYSDGVLLDRCIDGYGDFLIKRGDNYYLKLTLGNSNLFGDNNTPDRTNNELNTIRANISNENMSIYNRGITIKLGDFENAVESLKQLKAIVNDDGPQYIEQDGKEIKIYINLGMVCFEEDGVSGYGAIRRKSLDKFINTILSQYDVYIN